MYQDKTLTCVDCGAEFIWSAGEQEFFAQKGFDKPPMRCPEDRKKRRAEKEGRGGATNARPASAGPRTMYPITCAKCGKQGEVPFQPKSSAVLCADCFRNRHADGEAVQSAPTVATAPVTDTSQVPADNSVVAVPVADQSSDDVTPKPILPDTDEPSA